MAEITHFCHEHPLVLRKGFPAYNVDGYGSSCYLCDLVPSQIEGDNEMEHVDAYLCAICKEFFLHKSCAELPREIIHKQHNRHSLVLSQKSTNKNHLCYVCSRDITNVSYKCEICQFHLHTTCAFKEKNSAIPYNEKDCTIIHPSHKDHSMRLYPRAATVLCDACDDNKEDFFYHCLSCTYHIHRSCALLQSTTNREDHHHHSLSLSYGLPLVYHPFDFNCDICHLKLDKSQKAWLYYCPLCRYFVHIKCMGVRNSSNESETSAERYREGRVVYLPAPDKSKALIHRLLLGDKILDIPQEIQMFSHKHPLTLSNEEITGDLIDDDEEILCDGCIEPIPSPPYYHCRQCRYFLHLYCANLPKTLATSPSNLADSVERPLDDPNDPITLTLGITPRFYEDFGCSRCYRISNGFYYGCEFMGEQVYIDVKCVASMSMKTIYIKHESHHHPLVSDIGVKGDIKNIRDDYDYNNTMCKACNSSTVLDSTFCCESCEFCVHFECLMIPETTRHRFDSNHPLVLRYPPHDYHERPFDCAECEKEIHPLFWLFHCEECDLSFHLECINPAMGRVKFGQKLQISDHPHPLKFVREASVKSPCHKCKADINQDLIFECETCNFHLCRRCVRKLSL